MLKIRKYLSKTQWLYIIISVLFIVGQVWLDLKLPDYMSSITKLVQTEGSKMGDILMQGAYMLLCAFGSVLSSVIVGYFVAKVAAGLSRTLRRKVYDKTLEFSMEELDHFSIASLINRTTNDITQFQTLIAMGLQAMVKAPILAIWAIIKIAGKDWHWTTATGIAVFVLMLVMMLLLAIALPRFKRIQFLTDNINRVSREQLSGIRVVRAYNAEVYQEAKFDAANQDITDNNLVVGRTMALLQPMMNFISVGLTLAVYWIGAYLIYEAGIMKKLGIFADMIVFSNYAMQVIMAFMLMNMMFILLPRAEVSAKRVCEVLDKCIALVDPIKTIDSNSLDVENAGTVEFQNVSFTYPDGASDTLHDISFRINPGETVAFIGPTGCGKSTLINLIPRFYDVREGSVKVDGMDVRHYRQKELREKIGYVSQKSVLFSGTVASNILLGREKEKSIEKALEIAQASEFVYKMENGEDEVISQGGSNVSGGQKQRLSIARAIARDASILIFDDSFSALDYKTDSLLRKKLTEELPDITKIIVAQRISTVKNADKIIVLDHGRIVGMGRHEELMDNCRQYQEIAASQLSKEEL